MKPVLIMGRGVSSYQRQRSDGSQKGIYYTSDRYLFPDGSKRMKVLGLAISQSVKLILKVMDAKGELEASLNPEKGADDTLSTCF